MKRALPAINNQKAKVYRNLSSKCLSIIEGKLVVGHAMQVTLENVEFRVGEKVRQRVISERKKYVHAFAVGSLVNAQAEESQPLEGYKLVTYNPFKMGSFYIKETGEPVKTAEKAIVTSSGIFAYGVK